MVIGPHHECTQWLLPLLLWVRGSLLLLNQQSSSHSNYMMGHTALRAWQRVTWSLHLPFIVWRSLLFQVWFHPMTKSTLNLQWALNLVILVWWLGIRLMRFLTPGLQSGLLLIPMFILGSQIRCHHFPLSSGTGVWGLILSRPSHSWPWQGLDSILTDSIEITELDTSLDEPDAITSSVFSGFLHSVSTISDTSKPQLASSIRSYKLWCQARALLSPVSLATKMSTSKLIHYFSSHPAAVGFHSSTPPYNVTLTPANRKADHNLSEFQTGIGATAHAILTWSSSFPTSRVSLVDTSPLYQIMREVLFLFQKCVNYFSRFIAFWTMLFPSELEIQHVF